MPIAAVLTDLDGTLLEADGSLSSEARGALATLREQGIPVAPLTSKTEPELRVWIDRLGAGDHGAFENGAGWLGPAGPEVLKAAIPARRLATLLAEMAEQAGVEVRTLNDLSDRELGEMTGLPPGEIGPARARAYSLPFVADDEAGGRLAAQVDRRKGLRLVRGGRFWHLSGDHDKADAAGRILEQLGRPGLVVGLGDAPNDAGFLRLSDVAIVVPRAEGPDTSLTARLPRFRLAGAPGGRGWAEEVMSLLS